MTVNPWKDAALYLLHSVSAHVIPVMRTCEVILRFLTIFKRNYEAAAEAARHAIVRHPQHPLAYRLLAAAFGQLGRVDEASNALRKAIEVSPQAFNNYVRSRVPWYRPEDYEHMLDGLRKAGWQG